MNKQLNNFEAKHRNKYAIRRFSVGTASIIVGATLIFGLGHEAKAAEEITTSNQAKDSTSVQPDEPAKNAGTPDAQSANIDNTENQLNNDTLKDPIENDTPKDNKADTKQQLENTSKEPKVSQSTTESTPTKESTPTEQENPIEEKTPLTEPAPTINEAPETGVQPENNPQKFEESEEEKQLIKPVEAPQTLTASQPVNPVVETRGGEADITPQKTPVVTADLLKQSSQNKDKDTIEATAQNAQILRGAAYTAEDLKDVATDQKGSNVNDLVTVSNPQISETKIDPNQGGNFRLTADYKVDDKVKGGDYFTVQMPEYATFNGDLHYKNAEDKAYTVLATPTGMIVAVGVYDTNTKLLKYTFTDWVNDKQNISGKFDLTQFTDRDKATKKGVYTLNYDLAGEKYNPQITYDYDAHDKGLYPASVDTVITSVDALQKTNDFQQVIYVNPMDNNLASAILRIGPKDKDSNALLKIDDTQLRIYKVPNKADLTDSYAFDVSKYPDLTSNYRVDTDNHGNLLVNFGAISDSYVVVVDSKFDPTLSSNLTTRSILYARDYNGREATYYYDTNVVTQYSDGTGDGVLENYKIGDYVWEDINQNGIQESTEKSIEGVKVILKDKAGQILQTAVTDKYGNYLFNNLKNGEYVVVFETPDGYVPTTKESGNNREKDSDGLISYVTINGEDDYTIDSGFFKPVVATYNLGDYVWEDSNKDGIQNLNEVGIAGVTVTLTKPDGTKVTTVTDEKGKYKFTDLENGEYQVDFETPEGYKSTLIEQGNSRALDSEGTSATVKINNADDYTIDSGFYKPTVEPTPVPATYNLGDYVWEDSNKDGIQNSNEVGIAGVTVTLTKPDGTKVTTVTDEKGKYKFTDLENGEYQVDFETPEGYKSTLIEQGESRALDSEGTSATVKINNADDYTIDSGFYKPTVEPTPVPGTYSIGDKVWEDSSKDGVQNSNEKGISGVTVTLTKPDGSTETTVTDDNGIYHFTGLPNGEYTVTFETPKGYEPTKVNVGDKALDSDGQTVKVVVDNADDYTIDSGFYKPTVEPTPVPGTYNLGDYVWEDSNKDGIQNSNEKGIAGVTVTLTKPDGTTESVVTDAEGKYNFTGLENGEYTVKFTTPEGYTATKVNVGDQALDSNGLETKVVIDNADNYTIDSGFYKPVVEPTPVPATYTIGDKVWEDSNKDGVQNSNEKGISGVTVTLTKPDGSTETTVTDENGIYQFTGLYNGEYTVTFDTPKGYEATKVNVGDKALDSDGQTVKVVVDNADDFTIDSGFYKPVVEPTPVPATYTIGDKVWEDSNKDGVQNSNEKGISGVTVTLTKPDGSTETTVTDENGIYQFTGLYNGEYTVTFDTPKGYEATKVNVGDKALDSDGQTVKVVVDNADDFTIDSGFYKPVVEPEKPITPEKPEEPKVPEKPEKPEVPNTPEKPEKPNKPEVPTTPEQPSEPGQPTPPKAPKGDVAPHKVVKSEKQPEKAPKVSKDKALPETGEEGTNAGLIGTLFAALGSVFLFNRRKKETKDHK
ncbi:carboxypeptidase regulatory-like domain-containing protein [Staphylococcus simulans]|nr:SdrD B-like domain-containing protein [Staphylococcus simulans]MCE5148072.1 carboxypeptidase regulatory-like domain-containing protein [Staphylococcus simulans]